MPAAAKALFMNSYWNMSVLMLVAARAVIVVAQMVGNLHVAAARHDEEVTVGAHHLDLGAVEAREHRRGDYFLHGAAHRLAVAEIEHAIERAEQLIELMRAEQHGDLALAADVAHHPGRRAAARGRTRATFPRSAVVARGGRASAWSCRRRWGRARR